MKVRHANSKFLEGESIVKQGEYENGHTALWLLSPNGKPNATATVNLPNAPLRPGFVHIKSYGENEGLLKDLINSNIIESPIDDVPCGFGIAWVCKLKPSL